MKSPTVEEKELMEDKRCLKTEQSEISITENFAKYSKLQRKINSIDEKLNELRGNRNDITLQLLITYGLKILIGTIIFFCSVYFRNSPLFHIDERISLMPFNKIVSYPNGQNTVSFHFWVLCCSAVARLIKV